MRILFADDEENLQELVRSEVPRMGYAVTVCPDGLTAVAALEKEDFDCMIVDLQMPGLNGLQVIEKAAQLRPDMDTVIMTGNPSQETAIAAVQYQVFDYLTKPCRLADIAGLLGRVRERRQSRRQVAALEHRVRRAEGETRLVGEHPSMHETMRLIERVGASESTVLVRGETGCGKELVARALHENSGRADQPFVAINCGALPENLIESELFGHCRGAFTGADAARTGLFEMADGGTLFLDEIGELPLSMQAKLLRVLETGDIRRVGDNDTKHIDVRVVCATHRDLEQMVHEGQFREDLMFRINTFEVRVPALRQRASDIPVLAAHLLRRFRPDAKGSAEESFAPETLRVLGEHVWPGNVRELANVIEHAAILCDQLPILPEHLPRHFSNRQLRKELRANGPISLRDLEMHAIDEALERHDGNKPAAAAELGISLKTLYNKLNAAVENKAG
ncbi:sigma-54-dependent transcriptional regulator [Roseimaritima sediminicola]|uniref:sigma-54-dependent transcriptional regulator n=1 Tax=Roseimaritima sediminicola TaxID=2662066 RepID=UPI0012983E26|nr:sigma-54 dependent transcriptional regulator [Roseimaritima sediminicola]